MCRPSASAARIPSSTARQFNTGKAPGRPRQTGHVFAFGSSPKRVEHPQKIFDSVLSWACTSSPMIVSQSFMGFEFRVLSFELQPRNSKLRNPKLETGLWEQPDLRNPGVARFVFQCLPLSFQGGALNYHVVKA